MEHSTQVTGPSLVLTSALVAPSNSIGNSDYSLRYASASPVWNCSLSLNGMWLAASYGAPDCCIRIWKVRDEYNNSNNHNNFDNRNKNSSNDNDKSQNEWVLHSTLASVHERTVRCAAFAPLSKSCVLACASFDASVSIWEYSDVSDEWDCTTVLEGHENEVKHVVWNRTGSLLATCGRDKTVWIWETFLDGSIGGSTDNDFECIAVLNGHDGDVKCVQFAPSHGQWGDGDEILISGGYDNVIKIWAEDAGDWYCALSIADAHEDTVWSLALSPGGCRLLSASGDGSIGIFKSYTATEKGREQPYLGNESGGLWKCVGKLPGAHNSAIYSIHCAPSRVGHGRIVSAGADGRIMILREGLGSTSDKPSFAQEVAVQVPQGEVNCVCWHPWDGSIVYSATDDGSVLIWKYKP